MGSSNNRTSGSATKTPAIAARILQPPENSFVALLKSLSENPRPLSTLAARVSAFQASISINLVCMSPSRSGSTSVSACNIKECRSVSAASTTSIIVSSVAATS